MPDAASEEVASIIDHTWLQPDASRTAIARLCREGVEFGFATVCVNPVWVSACAQMLDADAPVRGTPAAHGHSGAGEGRRRPGICAVVGFPFGATPPDVKAYETRRAIADGATEIDMVIDIGALKSGDRATVERDIAAVTAVCRDARVLTKIIIEAALLSDEEKVTACTVAKAAGADCVKTSTGFGPGGATTSDVALMRRVVGPAMGVKAAGGIRDLSTFRAMVQAGASRIGSSAGVRIVEEARASASPHPASGG